MKLEGAEGGAEGGWRGGVWCSCIWSQEPQAWYQRVCQINTALSVAALSISTPSRRIPLSTPPPWARGWRRRMAGSGGRERILVWGVWRGWQRQCALGSSPHMCLELSAVLFQVKFPSEGCVLLDGYCPAEDNGGSVKDRMDSASGSTVLYNIEN